MIIEELITYGHKNIRATHRSTLEITKEDTLTSRGDCIIGVKANKSCKDLSEDLKKAIKREVPVKMIIEVNNFRDEIIGYGNENLILTDPISIVVRRGNYICPRTLMISANKAAFDLDRRLISIIRCHEIPIHIKIIIT